jgi:hypothetical protein
MTHYIRRPVENLNEARHQRFKQGHNYAMFIYMHVYSQIVYWADDARILICRNKRTLREQPDAVLQDFDSGSDSVL